jgi:parvulin-like peptidyl-prolyl isomerase
VLPGDGGYYVLKVLAHEDARTASLDEVRSRLRDFLVERRTEEEYQRLIDRLSGEIYVDVRSQAAPAP